MPADPKEIEKARQHAHRKYVIAMEKIARETQERLVAKRREAAAAGSLSTGAMSSFTAQLYGEQIRAMLQTRLAILLDAYDLYQVPLDEQIERQVLRELKDLRDTQVSNAEKAISLMVGLVPNAERYISEELSRIPDPTNAAKVEIEERKHRSRGAPVNASSNITPPRDAPALEPLIFVSCGQSTSAERQLGQTIANIVERETGCRAYFAENQTTLEGVTENILKRLNEAVGFIAIMHPRGNVSNPASPAEPSWVRGSVWVEQEIAIAAFVSQALARPMQVRAYVHESIRREGLRDKLHLNPTVFRNDSEILQDLALLLPSWRALAPKQRTEPLSLKPTIQFQRAPVPGGGADKRYRLEAGVENDGEQDVTDFRLEVEFPESLLDEGGHITRVSPAKNPGMALFRADNKLRRIEHFYPGDQVSDLISFHYAIRESVRRVTREELAENVIATVASGNMRPKTLTKSIAELTD